MSKIAFSPNDSGTGTFTIESPPTNDNRTLVLPDDSGELVTQNVVLFTENVVTSNYTLTLNDIAKVIAFNSSSSLTLTVPNNSSVTFPLGTVINVYRAGSGDVTISGASGVTIRNVGSIASQFVEVSLRKRATNEWVLTGDIV